MDNSAVTASPPHNWSVYYDAVAGRPPRDTLLKALDSFDAEDQDAIGQDAIGQDVSEGDAQGNGAIAPGHPRHWAVDLGCGDGRDTIALLHRGWRVLAIDGETQALDRLLGRPDLPPAAQHAPPLPTQILQTQQMRFEALELPAEVDLINASFCLPFCPTAAFPQLWHTIVTALKPGGRFCGQLFGDRDSWAVHPNRSHHTRDTVETLLQPFVVEWLEEEEHPGVTAIGETKHWHIFHIVARKR
jgi:tellurite methyltransferase